MSGGNGHWLDNYGNDYNPPDKLDAKGVGCALLISLGWLAILVWALLIRW